MLWVIISVHLLMAEDAIFVPREVFGHFSHCHRWADKLHTVYSQLSSIQVFRIIVQPAKFSVYDHPGNLYEYTVSYRKTLTQELKWKHIVLDSYKSLCHTSARLITMSTHTIPYTYQITGS